MTGLWWYLRPCPSHSFMHPLSKGELAGPGSGLGAGQVRGLDPHAPGSVSPSRARKQGFPGTASPVKKINSGGLTVTERMRPEVSGEVTLQPRPPAEGRWAGKDVGKGFWGGRNRLSRGPQGADCRLVRSGQRYCDGLWPMMARRRGGRPSELKARLPAAAG